MPYIIQKVSVEGFRGINKKLELEMHEGVCFLFGRNGAGKTSVLQAIEWCLTGRLPYLEGREFKYEDAIVNMFNPQKTAVVSVVLKDQNGKLMSVTRRKKMARSTGRGKAYLQFETEERLLKDEKASQELERVLGISLNDFPKVIYLHQEAIRDIVTADPKEMSETIDRLLGTFELRELAEALDARRLLNSETKKLKIRVDALERDKVVFVLKMRERLNQEKEALLKEGYSEQQLSKESIVQNVKELIEKVGVIADRLGSQLPTIKSPEPTVDSINSKLDTIEKQLKALDRFRTNAFSKVQERKLNLETLRKQLEEAKESLEQLGDVTSQSLLEAKRETEEKLKQSQFKLEEAQGHINKLMETKRKFDSTLEQIQSFKDRIFSIEKEFGDEEQHLKLIEKLRSDLAELQRETRKFSAYAQIVSLALEYLEESKPQECPVCSNPIEYRSLIIRLKKDTETLISVNIAKLREKELEVKDLCKKAEESLKEYKDIKDRLASEEKELETVKHEIELVIEKETDLGIVIDRAIESKRQELSSLTKQISTLTGNVAELDQKHKTLMTSIDKLEKTQATLQGVLKSSNVGKQLIDDLETEIQRICNSIRTYEDTKMIDGAGGESERLKKIVQYLKNKEELTELENQLPQVTELISDLKARMQRLSTLEQSLGAIREVTVAYQRDVVTNTLGSLEALINQFYNAIQGHPFFVKLKLEPEEEQPFVYSIKGLSSDLEQSTYIPTRFSNTQMNIVALSIFLSNNIKMGANLATIIMDDPAQSMDDEHKKLLAKVISTLSKEKQPIIATQDLGMKEVFETECKTHQTIEFVSWSHEELCFESKGI